MPGTCRHTVSKLASAVAGAVVVLSLSACASSRRAEQAEGPAPVWNFFSDGDEAKLAWGRPNSDEVGLMMTCKPHSQAISVYADGEGGRPRVVLSSGSAVSALEGVSEHDELEGAALVRASARLNDPAVMAFRKSGRLALVRKGGPRPMAASARDRSAVESFFAACG